jgi:hypothetical protein
LLKINLKPKILKKEEQMHKPKIGFMALLVSMLFILVGPVYAQEKEMLPRGVFFSTEEDFVTRIETPDGNPIISDGDLLHSSGHVYMRNSQLLAKFDVKYDLGLDAVDVLNVVDRIVAFSTELDHPGGAFTAGDLLTTTGGVIPNAGLLAAFNINPELDLGLDAVQFIGEKERIIQFLDLVRERGRKYWLEDPGRVPGYLKEYGIDIWFSTEGTAPSPQRPRFLDGDLLSAATGTIVLSNHDALPISVPAGIPKRGVDFGMDAVTCQGRGDQEKRGIKENIFYSTEILFEGQPFFTDGDVLRAGDGVAMINSDLILAFQPKTDFLGLDALSAWVSAPPPLCVQIEKIGGISVSDISPADGLATSLKSPFGQWVTIHGCLPNAPQVVPSQYEYRVQYRMDSETIWHPILMRQAVLRHSSLSPTGIGWQVTRPIWIAGIKVCNPPIPNKVERWIEGPDYDTNGTPDGWNKLDEYWKDSECNSGMPLVIWNTYGYGGDPDGKRPDGKYWLRLTLRKVSQPATEIYSPEVLMVLDNTVPDPLYMELKDFPTGVPLQCKLSASTADIVISIVGQARDNHFYYYNLHWTGGDVHTWKAIPLSAAEIAISPDYRYYNSGRADLGMQGTEPPTATNVPLGTYNFTQEYKNAKGTPPIPCGYTVQLTVFDRTIRGYLFKVENNKVFDILGWWTHYLVSFCYAL